MKCSDNMECERSVCDEICLIMKKDVKNSMSTTAIYVCLGSIRYKYKNNRRTTEYFILLDKKQ